MSTRRGLEPARKRTKKVKKGAAAAPPVTEEFISSLRGCCKGEEFNGRRSSRRAPGEKLRRAKAGTLDENIRDPRLWVLSDSHIPQKSVGK
jgi:hypothetical protein